MMKRNFLFLSTAIVATFSISVGAFVFSNSTPTPISVKGTTLSLTLNGSNGEVTSIIESETEATAKTSSGSTFTFALNGLSPSDNAFASFAKDGYLYTPYGINGLSCVSAVIQSGSLQVSFASSARLPKNSGATSGDGDWSLPQDLSAPVDAPSGMNFLKITATSAAVVTSITFEYDCTGVETTDTNIRVHVPSDSIFTHVWAWDAGGNQFQSWPGASLSVTQNGAWRSYTFENKESMNLLFSNNGADEGKTPDLSVSGYGDHYYYDSSWHGHAPVVVVSDYFPDTVYFTNNKNWATVNAYAWGGSPSMSWPGNAMTYFYTNANGEDIYKIEGMSKYKSIVFNNGSDQTVDISASDNNGKNAYYLLDEAYKINGKYQVGLWSESGETPLYPASRGLNILHCFDWSIPNITSRIDEIAAAGYTAIQTSPLQPVKDYKWSGNDKHSEWWRYYQPLGFSIAGEYGGDRTNLLINGASELSALTTAARAKGIRVIVDIVCNHLAGGDGTLGLNKDVQKFEPEIYNDASNTLHHIGQDIRDDSDPRRVLQGDFGDCPDLNTSNTTVQNRVLNYLKTLIDNGVTGFRFDAAKHIETSNEAQGYASNFWEKTLKAAKDYAKNKAISIWAYGEIMNPWPAGRNYLRYIENAYFDAVTDGQTGVNWRNNLGQNSLSGNYESHLSASNNVLWGESHDDYMSTDDKGVPNGPTSYVSGSVINNAYATLAARNGASTLYFPRPNRGSAIGTVTSDDWKCDYVKAANMFHSEMKSAGGEYITSYSGYTCIERNNGHSGIAYLNNDGNAKSLNLNVAASGNYRNVLTDEIVNLYTGFTIPANSWGFFVKA